MRGRLGTCLALLWALTACGGGDAASAPEPPPTAQPQAEEERVCLGGSYDPAEEGELVPREQACPDEQPPASPAAPASPWDPVDAFLPPQAATEAEEPGWSVTEPFEPEAGPVLDPCGEGAFPRGGAIAASGERVIGSEREAGGSGLRQEVFRYSSAQEAAQAFTAYADAVERCPQLDDPAAEGLGVRHETVLRDEVDGVQRLLVRRLSCTGPDMCPPQFAAYSFVAQTGDGLTAADYGQGEDGDPAEPARALLAAVAERLGATVRG